MKKMLFVFVVAMFLIAGCGNEPEPVETPDNTPSAPDAQQPSAQPSTDIDTVIKDNVSIQPAEQQLAGPEVDDTKMCPADVFMSYIGCKFDSENNLHIEIINQYRNLTGFVYYLYDGKERVGKTGLINEKFLNKERREWSINAASLETQFGPFDKIEITPVIEIDGELRACINKKISLMPYTGSCK